MPNTPRCPGSATAQCQEHHKDPSLVSDVQGKKKTREPEEAVRGLPNGIPTSNIPFPTDAHDEKIEKKIKKPWGSLCPLHAPPLLFRRIQAAVSPVETPMPGPASPKTKPSGEGGGGQHVLGGGTRKSPFLQQGGTARTQLHCQRH